MVIAEKPKSRHQFKINNYMKSIRIYFIVLFSFFYVSLNAQFFAGGNFSLNTSGGTRTATGTTTDSPSTFNFDLTPKAGIFLNEKLAAGAALDFSISTSKAFGNSTVTSKSSTIGIVPFLRYYAIKMDKFSVFGQGNLGLSFSNSSTNDEAITTDGPNYTRIYLNIVPGLAYDATENLSLETTFNVFSFGYYNTITKMGNIKDFASSFNIGAGLDNIITVGSISIGAIYKF